MDLLEKVQQRARNALAELSQKGTEEGWDQERLEKEKSLFMLSHEVTLCTALGCLELAASVPGFSELDITCDAHTPPGEGGSGAH